MKSIVLVSTALLACACGGASQSNSNNTNPQNSSAGGSPQASAANTKQQVTLVGCLNGPSSSSANATSPTGTAGTRARAGVGTGDAGRGAGTEAKYTLVNAAPESSESAGVGANGAGASGGPLVSARSSFDLDGVPPDARDSINKQIRVTGRLTDREIAIGSAPAGSTDSSTTRTGMNRRLVVDRIEVVAQSCAQQ